jgi:hypothetical protein
MSGKEQYVKLPREVLESASLRSLGIHGWRVVHFLMLEHLRRGGHRNGDLKAPHRQLVEFGIAARYVTAAICEAETSGLVVCHRQGQRIATTYELTWLPLHDGSAPGNLWCEYQPPRQCTHHKRRNLPNKGKAGLPNKGEADAPNLPNKGEAASSGNLPNKGKALYRSSYQGGGSLKEVEGEGVQPLVDRR